MDKSKINLLFSVPVISVAELYDLKKEEKDFLVNHKDLYQTTGGTLYSKDCYILDHKSQYYFKKYIIIKIQIYWHLDGSISIIILVAERVIQEYIFK